MKKSQEPVEVVFHGKKYQINADRLQIMNLLVSTYEAAVETNSELRKAQRELQDLSAELAAQGEELQVQNEELSTLAEELQKRTAELEAANRKLKFANREMESFSYSVSHDLKAPIRAIQGFSRMLLSEHAARLDEEGHRLLDVIVNNTQIMTKLIDDLLALSQVGRHQIRRAQVDLGGPGPAGIQTIAGTGAAKGDPVNRPRPAPGLGGPLPDQPDNDESAGQCHQIYPDQKTRGNRSRL